MKFRISLSTLRLLKIVFILVLGAYVALCIGLYFFQERLIFPASTLEPSYVFRFRQPFKEKYVFTSNGYSLHGIWFPRDNAKGTIFYLHGNGGTVEGWGSIAETYVDMGYQVFVLDYPGYGKSGGRIENEEQLFTDVLTAYDSLCSWVPEKEVIALGYSLGTGLATRIASVRHPRGLVLHAPYYNFTAMMRYRFPFVPTFLLRYKVKTNVFLPLCTMPVTIFHGDADEVIPLEMGRELYMCAKPSDRLVVLKGQGHMYMSENAAYLKLIPEILNVKN